MTGKQERCINIDWLECYCLEPSVHDADYFRAMHYQVNEREYGTRQYQQMFTVLDKDGHGFIEVRRQPVASALAGKSRGIFSPFSCHLKLCNRYCYAEDAVNLYADFLYQHGYQVQRIFRLDIALDFEKFDDGTDPKKFLLRYLEGKFTKVNQGNISAHGADTWESRDWHSVSWGAPTSMVSTKMYLKTLELRQAKDKPYIRYAWWCAHLVDDWDTLTKRAEDGSVYQPDIWRIEFSIRSSARGWYITDDQSGKRPQKISYEHTLDTYDTREKLVTAFDNLCRHYFHFKRFEPGKRKDLCADRVLFHFNNSTVYKLDRLMTDQPHDKSISALRHRIEQYRATHFDSEVRKACDTLLSQLQRESISNAIPSYQQGEAELLQRLIARRMQLPSESLTESIHTIQALLDIQDSIF